MLEMNAVKTENAECLFQKDPIEGHPTQGGVEVVSVSMCGGGSSSRTGPIKIGGGQGVCAPGRGGSGRGGNGGKLSASVLRLRECRECLRIGELLPHVRLNQFLSSWVQTWVQNIRVMSSVADLTHEFRSLLPIK
jgi:hypothetical protein